MEYGKKGGQHGSGRMKHCGPGMESCRPMPSHLKPKQSQVPSQSPSRQGHRKGKD
jgi:hypothetical protein